MNRTTTSIVPSLSSELSVRTHRTFQFFFFVFFFFNWNSQTVFLASWFFFFFLFFLSLHTMSSEISSQNGGGTENCQHINPFFVFFVVFRCCCRCCLFLSLQLFARLTWRFCSRFFFSLSSFTRSRKRDSKSIAVQRREWTERGDWMWTWWRRMSTDEKEMCVWHWTVIGFFFFFFFGRAHDLSLVVWRSCFCEPMDTLGVRVFVGHSKKFYRTLSVVSVVVQRQTEFMKGKLFGPLSGHILCVSRKPMATKHDEK